MTLDNFQTLIIEQIVKESTKPTNVDAVKIDWNCSVHNCIHILSLTYKFFHKISALTSRVTKLGTLLVWSNSYTQAADYLKTIYDKMSLKSRNIALDELVLALSPG